MGRCVDHEVPRVERLREEIFAGRLRPGTRIDQDALAESFGVSRLPVREALIALEREGLIDIVARHGAYVWSFGPDDLSDHYEVFGLVSGLAAERAAQRLSDEDIEELRRIVREMGETSESDRLERLNDRFHSIINRSAASRRLAWLIRLLASGVPRGFEAGGWELAARHHAKIVDRLGVAPRIVVVVLLLLLLALAGCGRSTKRSTAAAGAASTPTPVVDSPTPLAFVSRLRLTSSYL